METAVPQVVSVGAQPVTAAQAVSWPMAPVPVAEQVISQGWGYLDRWKV